MSSNLNTNLNNNKIKTAPITFHIPPELHVYLRKAIGAIKGSKRGVLGAALCESIVLWFEKHRKELEERGIDVDRAIEVATQYINSIKL